MQPAYLQKKAKKSCKMAMTIISKQIARYSFKASLNGGLHFAGRGVALFQRQEVEKSTRKK